MKRGVLRNGVVELLEPPPAEWREGKRLLVDEAPEEAPTSLEESFRKLEELVAQNDPEEIERLQIILTNMRQQARDLARQRHA